MAFFPRSPQSDLLSPRRYTPMSSSRDSPPTFGRRSGGGGNLEDLFSSPRRDQPSRFGSYSSRSFMDNPPLFSGRAGSMGGGSEGFLNRPGMGVGRRNMLSPWSSRADRPGLSGLFSRSSFQPGSRWGMGMGGERALMSGALSGLPRRERPAWNLPGSSQYGMGSGLAMGRGWGYPPSPSSREEELDEEELWEQMMALGLYEDWMVGTGGGHCMGMGMDAHHGHGGGGGHHCGSSRERERDLV